MASVYLGSADGELRTRPTYRATADPSTRRSDVSTWNADASTWGADVST